jgi:TonB-linked SusC/RagA family outer membrane protein
MKNLYINNFGDGLQHNSSRRHVSSYVFALSFALGLLVVIPGFAQNDSIIPTRRPAQGKVYPTTEVKGKVVDAATGKPLAGVEVQAYGDIHYAAMTEENGNYTIKVPKFVTSLIFRLEGYTLQQQAINRRTNGLDAALYTNKFAENYTRSTTAVRSASADNFDLSADMSIDPQIQQNLGSDIHTVMRGGQPGMGAMMLMNGINSLNANAQPLVVLDGVIMDMQYDRSILADGYYNNMLANISVDDIERVTVLKNGTAIYGAKGANGVLLIDTKRNKSMATKIDVSISGCFNLMPQLPDMMDASQYRDYTSELLQSTGTEAFDFKFLKTDPNYYYYKQYHNNTDWKDQVYRTAYSQNYSMNVQGGDEVASYNLSVGYAQGNSTLKDNDFSRFNLRLNSDIVLMKNLTARFDASYSDVTRDMRDDGVNADFTSSTITAPGFLSLIKSPFLNPYAYDTSGNISHFLSGADDYLSEVIGTNVSLANPSSILKYGEGKNKNDFGNRIITLAITPKYEINKHLSLQEHFSFTLFNTNEQYFLPMTGVPSFTIKGLGTVNNMAKSLAGSENLFQSDTRLNWNNKFGGHAFDIFGGFRYESQSYSLDVLSGYNTGNDKTPNMSTGLAFKKTLGADDKSKDMTWYANANYNYEEKYYLTGGLSMAASSRFGDDVNNGLNLCGVRWGFFPSAEAAWVLTNEQWFHPNRGVNYLKLNVGFDMAGNNDVNYTASRTYLTANQILQSIDGIAVANIGNTKLQWETTKRVTAGLQGNFWDNRINLNLHVFKGWTSNLLALQQLSWVSGLKTNWSNSGKLENTGVDVNFNVKMLNLKNWKWTIGASAGHYNNKVTALPDGKSFTTTAYNGTILTQVGSPVGLFYGYKTAGVYSTTAEAKAEGHYQTDAAGNKSYFKAGDMKFVDVNGDKLIGDADKVVIGDPNPDIYGGFYTNLNWKNWALNINFTYSLGNDVYNYERSILECGSRFFNQTTALTNRWTTEGQKTDIPRISYEDETGNSRFSDRWIEDGSYLRLKNVTLSYTLPLNWIYLKGFTVWASAQNLVTFTKYLGSDPEFSCSNNALLQGIDRGILSLGRNFTLGVKINL